MNANAKITVQPDGTLTVPDQPVIPFIEGDGIGPDIWRATRLVIDRSVTACFGGRRQIAWLEVLAGEKGFQQTGEWLPEETLDTIREHVVAIKGPMTTPVGKGIRSVNVAIRQKLDLYACVRPVKYIENVPSPMKHPEKIDMVIFRENTEDLYAGIERMVDEDTAESIKLITRGASQRICRFAFDYARREGRRKVTAVHKANILKFSDGLFLEVARQVAQDYPDIEFEDRIVDNMAMQLVQKPHIYDVLVLPNLYGDIISDLCAGLVGGLGVAPSANIGEGIQVFEPVHGSAPKYTGMNKVNPTAQILTGVLMLHYIGEEEAARRIYEATTAVIAEGKTVTYDLGGEAGTSQMADAIIGML